MNVVPRFSWYLLGVYGVPRNTSIAAAFRPAGVGVNVCVGYRLEDAYGAGPLGWSDDRALSVVSHVVTESACLLCAVLIVVNDSEAGSRGGVYGSLLGMRTWIVSVLPVLSLLLRSGLVLRLLLLLISVICRRSECMLFCFLSARTGLIEKESVPRLRCDGISGNMVGGVDGV